MRFCLVEFIHSFFYRSFVMPGVGMVSISVSNSSGRTMEDRMMLVGSLSEDMVSGNFAGSRRLR